MIIGVPKEIKTREYRVGMTPAGVRALVGARPPGARRDGRGRGQRHHRRGVRRARARTIVEDRGRGVGRRDGRQGEGAARRPSSATSARASSSTRTSTSPPSPSSPASSPRTKVIGVAYETIQLDDGSLPLLRPMSEVAGRMAVQVGATCLEKERGGKGVLLGGVPGTRRGRVVILGGGVVGRNAATIAIGMGAQVTVLDVRAETMATSRTSSAAPSRRSTRTPRTSRTRCTRADLVVGAVLVPGAKAPQLVTEELIAQDGEGHASSSTSPSIRAAASRPAARPRTTTRPTRCTASSTTASPTCPAPSRTPAPGRSPTRPARTRSSSPSKGVVAAARADRAVMLGINTYGGHVTYGPVAAAHKLEYLPVERALAG